MTQWQTAQLTRTKLAITDDPAIIDWPTRWVWRTVIVLDPDQYYYPEWIDPLVLTANCVLLYITLIRIRPSTHCDPVRRLLLLFRLTQTDPVGIVDDILGGQWPYWMTIDGPRLTSDVVGRPDPDCYYWLGSWPSGGEPVTGPGPLVLLVIRFDWVIIIEVLVIELTQLTQPR